MNLDFEMHKAEPVVTNHLSVVVDFGGLGSLLLSFSPLLPGFIIIIVIIH